MLSIVVRFLGALLCSRIGGATIGCKSTLIAFARLEGHRGDDSGIRRSEPRIYRSVFDALDDRGYAGLIRSRQSVGAGSGQAGSGDPGLSECDMPSTAPSDTRGAYYLPYVSAGFSARRERMGRKR